MPSPIDCNGHRTRNTYGQPPDQQENARANAKHPRITFSRSTGSSRARWPRFTTSAYCPRCAHLATGISRTESRSGSVLERRLKGHSRSSPGATPLSVEPVEDRAAGGRHALPLRRGGRPSSDSLTPRSSTTAGRVATSEHDNRDDDSRAAHSHRVGCRLELSAASSAYSSRSNTSLHRPSGLGRSCGIGCHERDRCVGPRGVGRLGR